MSEEHARRLQEQQPRVHQEQQQRQVKVKVHNQRWVTTGEKFLYSVVSGIVVLASVFVVSYSSSLDSLNRDMQQLEDNVQNQKIQNQNLQYKVEELSNPERIMRIAKANGLEIRQSKVKQATTLIN